MDKDLESLAGQINALRAVLVVMLANQAAQQPDPQAAIKAFGAGIDRRFRFMAEAPAGADAATASAVQTASLEAAQDFFERVSSLAAELSERRP